MIATIRIALWVMLTTIVLASATLVTRTALHGQLAERHRQVEQEEVSTTLPPTRESEDRVHRVAIKQEAIADLLDGRLTLEETASRFWDVTIEDDDAMAFLRNGNPGRSDEELIVHQVMTYARVQANSNPKKFSARYAQLTSEAKSFRLRTFISH